MLDPPPVRPRATLRTVAEQAGVSMKTVSRVLNHEPGVKPETAARVTHAMRLLHYRPDGNARLLRSRTAMRAKHIVAIGLLVRDLTDPGLTCLIRSTVDTATVDGAVVLTASSAGDPDRERDLALLLHARGIDGLVIMPAATDYTYLAKHIDAGLAVIFLGEVTGADTDTIAADAVARNPELIGRTAVHRLLQRLAGDAGPRLRFDIPASLIPHSSGEPAQPGNVHC